MIKQFSNLDTISFIAHIQYHRIYSTIPWSMYLLTVLTYQRCRTRHFLFFSFLQSFERPRNILESEIAIEQGYRSIVSEQQLPFLLHTPQITPPQM